MNEANFIPLSDVIIGDRTRDYDEEHGQAMLQNIVDTGHLLQAICLSDDNKLIAGLHRWHAIAAVHTMQHPIKYGDELIPLGTIPFVRLSELTAKQLLELELAENLFRKELSWQEKDAALVRLHRMRVDEEGEKELPTFQETAKRLADVTGRSTKQLAKSISRAVLLQDAMERAPELADARSQTEAISMLKSNIHRIAEGLLSQGFDTTQSHHRLIHGDCTALLPEFKENDFDLILVDPPYGVGADTWNSKFEDAPHRYKDTWEEAQRIALSIFHFGFHLCRPRANIFMFCAVERWHELRDMAEAAGWSVWRRPVIWHKSNEGIRPWGQKGYAYCYEAFLFAAKGERGLTKTGPDVITGIYKVRDREHGASKPPLLYRNLIESACLPGDRILDPCCGSGTIFEAATQASMVAVGIEKDPHYFGMAQARLIETMTGETTEDENALNS